MGKAKKYKALRKELGVDNKAGRMYTATNTVNWTKTDKETGEKETVMITNTFVSSGDRRNYREAKKAI